MKISSFSIMLLTMAGVEGQFTPGNSADICNEGSFVSHPEYDGIQEYNNDIDSTVTICPYVPGNNVVVTFETFETDVRQGIFSGATVGGTDSIQIFNSNNTDDLSTRFLTQRTTIPFWRHENGLRSGYPVEEGPFASTHISGCLSFIFLTDANLVSTGFNATVDCGPTAAPTASPADSPSSECEGKGYSEAQCESQGYRNRNLKAVSSRILKEDHKECMDVDHDMFLVMESAHFAGVAVPLNDAPCPPVVFHSKIALDKSIQKVAMIADADEVADFDASSMHHLGTKPLAEIVDAFDNAPVGKDGAKFYDSITNNCVALLRNMADPLDVKVDDAMIDFVTQKLLSNADINSWDGIKNSPGLSLLVEGGKRMLKAANEEDLVRKLIKLYV